MAAARERLAAVDRELEVLRDQRRRLEQLAEVCAGGDDGCLTLAVAGDR